MEEAGQSSDKKEETLQVFNICDCTTRCFYRDSKILEISPQNEEQVNFLETFREHPIVELSSSRTKVLDPLNVLVPSEMQLEFQNALESKSVQYKVIVEDVDALVEKEKDEQKSQPDFKDGKFNLQKYHRYSNIREYLDQLAGKHPDLVHLEYYGRSTEGRRLILIRIASDVPGKIKPAIFVDAGIHGCEWIGPASVLYIINQLLENPEHKNLIDNVDWLIIPLVNPDGYEFTHTDERFWRKTRSKGNKFDGVDANRNFDFNWLGKGSSTVENSITYAGPNPFSEPETSALAKVLRKYAKQIKVYVTMHSAAQCVLYPWGFTEELPEDVDELHNLATEVREAICSMNGTTYRIGNSASVLLPSAGSSRDWAKGVLGIKWSYTLELPGGGEHGFDLPPNRILFVSREVFEGIKAFHEFVENKYVKL